MTSTGQRYAEVLKPICGLLALAVLPRQCCASKAARSTRKAVFTGEPQTGRGKSIQMSWWFAYLNCFPGSLEQSPLSKSHENWIESAGFQPCVPADVISIFPVLRMLEKNIQDPEGLW